MEASSTLWELPRRALPVLEKLLPSLAELLKDKLEPNIWELSRDSLEDAWITLETVNNEPSLAVALMDTQLPIALDPKRDNAAPSDEDKEAEQLLPNFTILLIENALESIVLSKIDRMPLICPP